MKSLDAARLRVAFTGLERAASTKEQARPALAAMLARLGKPAEAWQPLEEDLGRGLLDELAARQDQRLAPAERDRLRELTAALDRLDKLVETTPRDLDRAERAKQFADLNRQRELASIALGEFQSSLVRDHDALAGKVATLNEIQAALPVDTALLGWVDIMPVGPNAVDPDGEHWGVVVRSRGIPTWIPIAGTGPDRQWTNDDTGLADRVRTELRIRPVAGKADLRPLVEKLRAQRLEPLAKALGASADGQPPARRLIVLPSRAMAGIPVEAILADDDTRTVSYAPSATVLKYLRDQPRPDRRAGLLALGDPIYERPDKSSEPQPMPDHGLLVNVVTPGSNGATHGLKAGDVLLAYDGQVLNKRDDLKAIADGDKPISIEIWRDGHSLHRDLAPGRLGIVVDTRPAPVAIAEERELQRLLVAARGGTTTSLPYRARDTKLRPSPGCSDLTIVLPASCSVLSPASKSWTAWPPRANWSIRLHSPGDARRGRRGCSRPLGGDHDPDWPARPVRAVLHQKPVFDGRLSVREIQHGWDLKAELVTLSACETALGRDAGGEGFVGFIQALLMSGARSVCLSLWKVDDTATSLLMQRFYANLLGRPTRAHQRRCPRRRPSARRRSGCATGAVPTSLDLTAEQSGGVERGKGTKARQPAEVTATVPAGGDNDRPYAPPHFWAAFVLAGDPD